MIRTLIVAAICLLSVVPLNAQDFYELATVGIGAGVAIPVGSTNDRAGAGFNFVANGGPRFGDNFSLLFDFSYNDMDLDAFNGGGNDTLIDANMKMWSVTVNPTFEFIDLEEFGAYGTGGYGVYNRRLDLTRADPRIGVVCDPWWGVCFNDLVLTDTTLAEQNTYKGGFNVGGGFTVGSRTKFFVEVRYHHMFTTNESTQVVPITFGFRW
jgi:opacity protein-like surface antigen